MMKNVWILSCAWLALLLLAGACGDIVVAPAPDSVAADTTADGSATVDVVPPEDGSDPGGEDALPGPDGSVLCVDDNDCDDDNPCTEDLCVPETGCEHEPVTEGTACDDDDPCTADDACVGTVCEGTPVPGCGQCEGDEDCNDDNPCTVDRCDTDAGDCVNTGLPFGSPCVEAETEQPGLCDASKTCRAFERAFWPLEAAPGDSFLTLRALWGHEDADGAYRLYGAGNRRREFDAVETEMEATIVELELGENGELLAPYLQGFGGGSFTDMHAGLAVGGAGPAYLVRDAQWEPVSFRQANFESAIFDTSLRSAWGQYEFRTVGSSWFVADTTGNRYYCTGPESLLLDEWSCTMQEARSETILPVGPLWGFGAESPTEQVGVWSFTNPEGGKGPIWYGSPSDRVDPGFLEWTFDAPGCHPEAGGGCAQANLWLDAHGAANADGDIALLGVGSEGTLQRLKGFTDGWASIAPASGDLGVRDPAGFEWTGVYVVDDHAFVVGHASGCPGEEPVSGVGCRAVGLLHYDLTRNNPTGFLPLGTRTCSVTFGEADSCGTFLIDTALMTSIWGYRANGGDKLHLWVSGLWPTHDEDGSLILRTVVYHVLLGL